MKKLFVFVLITTLSFSSLVFANSFDSRKQTAPNNVFLYDDKDDLDDRYDDKDDLDDRYDDDKNDLDDRYDDDRDDLDDRYDDDDNNTNRPISVVLNGKKMTFTEAPRKIDGRVMVPMRTIFEALDMKVEWKESSKTIVATSSKYSISLQAGNKTATVNNKNITLDVAPKIVNGTTFVPVRFISETTGYSVDWEDDNQTVYIVSK